MSKKMNVAQQRSFMKAMPPNQMMMVKNHCDSCQMRGEGIGDIIKSIGKVLGPLVKQFGPTILRELVLPFINKKMKGNGMMMPGYGLNLPGNGMMMPGYGLKLSGQGHVMKNTGKGSQMMKDRMMKVRAMKKM
jgi:hypothetical protein